MSETPNIIPVFKEIQQRIFKELSSAKDSIYIAVAWLTDKEILDLLKEKALQGLDVNVIVDNNDDNLKYAQLHYEELKNAGVELDLIGQNIDFGRKMHNKFCVIDWKTVITGSYNWSRNAQTNEENIIILRNEETAKEFLEEFDRIKEEFCKEHGRLEELVYWFKRKIYQIKKGKPPVIILFQADGKCLSKSQPVTFKWKIENDFTNLFLNEIEITGKTQHTITDGTNKEFYLKAINTKWQEHRGILQTTSLPINIEIDSTPATITNFSANNLFVKNQETIILTWKISDAVEVELIGFGKIEGTSFEVVPTRDTTYILRAYAFNGNYVESSILIETDKTPPDIIQFTADRNFTEDKNPIKLNWEIEGAIEAEISHVGAVDFKKGVSEVFPKQDTNYLLSTTSFYGVSSKREIKIEVSKQPPIIQDFSADSYILMDSLPAKLTWLIHNAEQIVIDNSVGEVTDLDFAEVHNMKDTDYTIEAVSYFGIKASKAITITVNKTPPLIHSFHSDKEFILADHNVKLTWKTSGAKEVHLSGTGKVGQSGSLSIPVNVDTYFKLIATNYFGFSSEQIVFIRILPIPLIEKLIVPEIDIRLVTKLEYQALMRNVNFQKIDLKTDYLKDLKTDLFSIGEQEYRQITSDKISVSGFIDYLKNGTNELKKTISSNGINNQINE